MSFTLPEFQAHAGSASVTGDLARLAAHKIRESQLRQLRQLGRDTTVGCCFCAKSAIHAGELLPGSSIDLNARKFFHWNMRLDAFHALFTLEALEAPDSSMISFSGNGKPAVDNLSGRWQ